MISSRGRDWHRSDWAFTACWSVRNSNSCGARTGVLPMDDVGAKVAGELVAASVTQLPNDGTRKRKSMNR